MLAAVTVIVVLGALVMGLYDLRFWRKRSEFWKQAFYEEHAEFMRHLTDELDEINALTAKGEPRP